MTGPVKSKREKEWDPEDTWAMTGEPMNQEKEKEKTTPVAKPTKKATPTVKPTLEVEKNTTIEVETPKSPTPNKIETIETAITPDISNPETVVDDIEREKNHDED